MRKVLILPQWQRTCVSTHATALLLRELLDPLPPHGDGVGLRRVQWQCHSDNAASKKAAERLGFIFEGTNRWCRALPDGKAGTAMVGRGRLLGSELQARHSCMLAICWDDWEGGTRDKINSLMKR